MDISIIIPNYQSEHHLASCINSIKAHLKGILHEIIIINNDQAPITVVSNGDDLKIIENGINSGFAKACNIGAEMSQGEILFFLNPDTEIISGNIIDLKEKLDDAHVGIVSPVLVTTEGGKQLWGAGWDVTLASTVLNNIGFNRSKIFWNKKSPKCDPDWTSGAALAIKKALFKELGGFDEKFFMYFEDVDLCKRVRNKGLRISLLPSIQIKHHCGQSFSGSDLQKKYYYESQDYYFKKHFGNFSLFLMKNLRKALFLLKKTD